MPGEFFFMAMGGLGVSLAGFAGLIAALTPGQQRDSAVARWRISQIVIWGLHVTFLGFGIIATSALVDHVPTTARIGSGAAALILALREWRSSRPGPAWPDEGRRRFVMLLAAATVAFFLGNVVVGSVGYLHVIMLVMLLAPAMVFVSAVRDATATPTALAAHVEPESASN